MSSAQTSAGAAVITFKQLGDTLLLEPALSHLRSRFGIPATLFAKPGFEPLIELMADARLPGDSPERFEQLWVFERGSRAARKAFFVAAEEKRLVLLREKYRRWYHRLIFDEIRAEKPKHYEYRARFLHRKAGGANAEFRPPILQTPPLEWAPSTPVLNAFILLCPTAAWESKRWSVDAWGGAIHEIARQCGMPMVMVGGGSEWERAHAFEIENMAGSVLSNLVGRTSLRELLFLVSKASAALCIDGAVSHLAAAFGVPSVTMFGPTRAEEWHWSTTRSVALRAGDFVAEKLPGLSNLPVEPVVSATVDIINSGP